MSDHDYTTTDKLHLQRRDALLAIAREGRQDDASQHAVALRLEVMRATGRYARTKEPADFDRMQAAAERLDAWIAGLEVALCPLPLPIDVLGVIRVAHSECAPLDEGDGLLDERRVA